MPSKEQLFRVDARKQKKSVNFLEGPLDVLIIYLSAGGRAVEYHTFPFPLLAIIIEPPDRYHCPAYGGRVEDERSVLPISRCPVLDLVLSLVSLHQESKQSKPVTVSMVDGPSHM